MSEKNEDNKMESSGLEAVVLTAKSHAQMEQFRSVHETQVLAILLSDLEGSTVQQHKLGNVRAAELVKAHRSIFRKVLGSFDGQEVETAGDSFLVVFAAPSEAVKFALLMQAAMRERRQHEPELPSVRVGIHQGQVVVERHAEGPKAMDIYGLQVSTTARIMDLGRGGQILCSRAVFDDARVILRGDDLQGVAPVAWRNHGPYRFKGLEDAYDVCEVGEDGAAPLEAPGASTKSWPADYTVEELGWRPAAGVVVPQTNWVLEERLGEEKVEGDGLRKYKGEFGEVWKAWNPSDKSHQVFKFCFRRDRVPALKREARLLKRLGKYRHPNLVEVYDVTEADRPPYYLEMEYVEGPSLDQWLATDPLLKERIEIIAQVADALDAVHAAGIYHRDIKPSNILLTKREDGALQAKLTDFGLGAADDEELLKSIYTSRVEGIAGTWDYIAPELRKGAKASPQSDLYSLGVTLYQMAIGDLQHTLGDWESHVESEVLREDIRRCIATNPGHPPMHCNKPRAALGASGAPCPGPAQP
jgi:class 3 adenylate cyclase/predicted Ser/Thr protein kinase